MIEEKFANKQILITGGLGFIGSNLAIKLVNAGAHVTVIDSMNPNYGGNLFNVQPVKNYLHINYSDIRDEHSLRYLIKDKDYIFNLAGQTSHMDSMTDPFVDLEINAAAQLKLLETCKKYNPKVKIVYASTRQIYGKPQYLPVDEQHPIVPVDVNGINKSAGEQYHMLYSKVYDISCVCLRLTNTYGPRMRIKDARQTFLGIWLKHALQQEPFEVWGGEQLRDYNYVDDVIDALILAVSNTNCFGKIYNLGHDEILTLRDTAKIFKTLEPSVEFNIVQYPEERKKIDIGDYYSDFKLFNKDAGWSPKYAFKTGLEKTLNYYRTNLDAYL